jgi:hemoglobin
MTNPVASSLYSRLGGYDAIAAVADDLLPRLMSDPQLGRFWANRAADSIRREKQLLIDFLCANAGGNLYYTGRNMAASHKGMGISASDWDKFLVHLRQVPGSGPGTPRCSVLCGQSESRHR